MRYLTDLRNHRLACIGVFGRPSDKWSEEEFQRSPEETAEAYGIMLAMELRLKAVWYRKALGEREADATG